jgi:hypothetical protein
MQIKKRSQLRKNKMRMKTKTMMNTKMKIKMRKMRETRNLLRIKKKILMLLKEKLEKDTTISHSQSWITRLEILSMSIELLKRLKIMS